MLIYLINKSLNYGAVIRIVTVIIESFVHYKNFVNIIANTNEISRMSLLEFKFLLNFDKIRKSAWRTFAIVILTICILHGAVTYNHIILGNGIFWMSVGAPPMFFVAIVNYKLVFYIKLMNIQLEFLEQILLVVFDSRSLGSMKNSIVHLRPANPRMFFETKLRRLNTSRRMYNLIKENVDMMNQSHGLTLLLSIWNAVTSITISGFEFITIMMGHSDQRKVLSECEANCSKQL